jgi:hypothetical protein
MCGMTDMEVLQASLQFIFSFVSAFAKMGRAAVGCVMACRLSAPIEKFGSHWTDFH